MKNEIDIKQIDEQLDSNNEIIGATDTENYAEKIEEGRTSLYTTYEKSKLKSRIMMGIVVAAVVACFIMVSQNNMVLQIIGYCVGGAAFIFMLVHHLMTRNLLPNQTKDYIKLVTTSLNSRAFRSGDFKEVTVNQDERLELGDVASDDVYAGVNSIASRNVVHGKYQGHTVLISDLALYTNQGRNRQTNFVGKYITLKNDLSFEGKIILVNKKNEEPIDPSNNLDNLILLHEEDSFAIYGQEGLKYESILGKDFIKKIKSITLTETLLNVNIVIWAGHSAAYLSYNDAIIALPFDKPFDKNAFEEYISNQNTILDAFKSLLG